MRKSNVPPQNSKSHEPLSQKFFIISLVSGMKSFNFYKRTEFLTSTSPTNIPRFLREGLRDLDGSESHKCLKLRKTIIKS